MARHILSEKVSEHRLNLMASVIRQQLSIIPEQRGKLMKEQAAWYDTHDSESIRVDLQISSESELHLSEDPFAPSSKHSDEE